MNPALEPREDPELERLLATLERLLQGEPARPGRSGMSLRRAVEAVLRHPDRQLRVESLLVAVEQMQDPDPDRLMELMNDPTSTRRADTAAPHFTTVDGGFCFSRAWDRQIRIEHDTPANAELLRLLDLLLRDLNGLAGRRRSSRAGGDCTAPAQQERITALRRELENWRQALLQLDLRGGRTGAHSGTVLEQDPRYRVIRRALQQYRRHRRERPATGCTIAPSGPAAGQGPEE